MNSSEDIPKFVVLAILDGWGIAPDGPGNAITLANTVNMDKFWLSYPHTHLDASGQAVGLPRGEDGNTETGHINLGAGRIVYQDLERINMAVADGGFFQNQVLLGAIDHAKKNNSKLHFMGLVGAGGVHSNLEHLFALIRLASLKKFENFYVHVFTDGRDSPPTAAKTYLKSLEDVLSKEGGGKIASIMGRYWAMDRDQRWERTKRAYFALTRGVATLVKTPEDAVNNSYSQGKTDEFIEPSLVIGENSKPIALIEDKDAVVFFNFRIDRPRQLTKAFVYSDFKNANISFDKKDTESAPLSQAEPFDRGNVLANLYFVTMTDYGKPIIEAGAKAAFPPEVIDTPVSSVISGNGGKQLKITESEKERFVTFYFNGLREQSFPLEERVIIPSPKVSTYDQKPEMSDQEVTNTLIDKLSTGDFQFVVVNYPNADMVGHTGNIGAAVKAIESLDDCIGKVANFILAYDGILIITADHGNAEEMINLSSGEIDTEHSTNKVPFIAIGHRFMGKAQMLRSGILADVSPTILQLLHISVPGSMTGRDLLAEVTSE
jgi:2,3-bisphosphoglycerate-independent phosphoglycerate mutase